MVFLNCEPGESSPNCTVVISGPPRSGTSLIAAMLRAAGLWLGDLPSADSHEDVDFALSFEPPAQRTRRLSVAAANLDHPLLALRGVDVRTLRSKIEIRNSRWQKWGFKRPNALLTLRDPGLAMFREPRVIMTLRDPLAIAQRIVVAHPFVPIDDALRIARNMTNANLKVVLKIKAPTLLLSYDKVYADRDLLLATLCDFCGLDVPAGGFQNIARYVEDAHSEYQRLREYRPSCRRQCRGG
jgi:hypothetical protein